MEISRLDSSKKKKKNPDQFNLSDSQDLLGNSLKMTFDVKGLAFSVNMAHKKRFLEDRVFPNTKKNSV